MCDMDRVEKGWYIYLYIGMCMWVGNGEKKGWQGVVCEGKVFWLWRGWCRIVMGSV